MRVLPLTKALRQALRALGEVGCLVAASNHHDRWLLSWHRAFPDAEVFVSAGIPRKVRKEPSAFRAFLDTVTRWHFDRIIVCHGGILEDDAHGRLARLSAPYLRLQHLPASGTVRELDGSRSGPTSANGSAGARPGARADRAEQK